MNSSIGIHTTAKAQQVQRRSIVNQRWKKGTYTQNEDIIIIKSLDEANMSMLASSTLLIIIMSSFCVNAPFFYSFQEVILVSLPHLDIYLEG